MQTTASQVSRLLLCCHSHDMSPLMMLSVLMRAHELCNASEGPIVLPGEAPIGGVVPMPAYS